jgi:hypothetical protein
VLESNNDVYVEDGKQYIQSNGEWVEYPYTLTPRKQPRAADEPVAEILVHQPINPDSLMYDHFNPEEAQAREEKYIEPGVNRQLREGTAAADYFIKKN